MNRSPYQKFHFFTELIFNKLFYATPQVHNKFSARFNHWAIHYLYRNKTFNLLSKSEKLACYRVWRVQLSSLNFNGQTLIKEFFFLDASKSWVSQTLIYLLLMTIVKLLTTLIIQMHMWNDVKNLILSPFKNEKIEVIMVMLVIPFFVNVLLFWVTDNFLMRNKKHFLGHHQLRQTGSKRKRRGHSILEKVKVKYQNSNGSQRIFKKYESESDLLSSEDDPIIQIQDGTPSSATNTIRIQQRSNSTQSS